MSTVTEIEVAEPLTPQSQRGQVAPAQILIEPESELRVIISCPTQKVQKVDIHIGVRKKGLPNPIRVDLGE